MRYMFSYCSLLKELNLFSEKELKIEDAKRKISEISVTDIVRVSKNLKLDTVYFLCGKEDDGSDE